VSFHAPRWASADAAAVAAAHATLVGLYPDQRSLLDAAYTSSLDSIADGQARQIGLAIGEHVAERMLTLRAADGAAQAITAPYMPGDQPGDWVPAPPAFLPALDPGWGSVAPF